MSLLWWLMGTVLTVLSFLLLIAGLQGREGVIRIGKKDIVEIEEPSEAQQNRSVNVSNVILGFVGMLVGPATVIAFAI